MNMEKVNHPKHYNCHPSGVECIEVIRHYCFDIGCAIKYLWRAGLKTEGGMTNVEKEIEDLEKALFYIDDFLNNMPCSQYTRKLEHPSGATVSEIISCYDYTIGSAIAYMWWVGITIHGMVYVPSDATNRLFLAKRSIRLRIDELKSGEDEK